MSSHADRFTIELFPDGSFNLHCEKLNRRIDGILVVHELFNDLIREIELSEAFVDKKEDKYVCTNCGEKFSNFSEGLAHGNTHTWGGLMLKEDKK